MTSELKPCPFCGNPPIFKELNGLYLRGCSRGYPCPEPVIFDSKAEAIETWNHRPGEDALRAEVARLRAAIQGFDNYLNPSIPFDRSKGDKIPVTSDEWYDQLRTKIRAALEANAEKGEGDGLGD